MNVTVFFIGRYKQLIGKTKQVPLQKEDTILDVVEYLAKQYPQLSKDKRFLIVSKNNTFTSLTDTIEAGDTLTIVPPVVSGG